jgi:Asp-tRNA(Asn)/Glu-tRNA(Gln) amidotransferase A subunit family amidase
MVTSNGMPAPEVPVHCPGRVPDGVLDAFWRYDAALLANDRDVLDDLFMPGPDTVRGDGRVLLVGHEAIAGFRSGRAVIPTRKVAELQVRVLAPDAVLIMARTADGAAAGLQTQLWQHTAGGWRVAAAHVSLPARPAPAPRSMPSAPVDPAVWRVAGIPLLPPLGRGPLDGLGVAVKDLIAVEGHPTGGGVPAYLAGQSARPASAPAVTALRRAGAHLAGIAQADEFAYSIAGSNSHYGTAPNPAAPARLGGGSSSGPAAAVALGQAQVGLGTDTAGSIRVPAAYQGLVGFRPTHGAVPSDGVLPLAPSFDTVGWLTRDIATSAAVAAVLLPARNGTPTASARVLRLPLAERLAEPLTRDLFAGAVAAFEAAGTLPPARQAALTAATLDEWFAAFRTVQAYEAWATHGSWIEAHPGSLGPDVAARFAAAAAVTGEEAAAARATVAAARDQLREWLDGAILVLPTVPGPAPLRTAGPAEIDDVRGRTLRISCLSPIAGAPAISLPMAGHDAPVGLCLIGAPGSDLALLSTAARLTAPALAGTASAISTAPPTAVAPERTR